MTVRRRLLVTGRVQAVSCRDWPVDGWPRDRANGNVEAVAGGAPEMVEAIVARAREGAPASRVAAVAVRIGAPGESPVGVIERVTV